MKRRFAAVAAIAALAVGPVIAAEGSGEQVCPNGKLVAVKVSSSGNNAELRQDKPPPPGAHFEDRFGKATVRSDGDSASGNVPLRIECR